MTVRALRVYAIEARATDTRTNMRTITAPPPSTPPPAGGSLVAIDIDPTDGICYCQDECKKCSSDAEISVTLGIVKGFGELPESCGDGTLVCDHDGGRRLAEASRDGDGDGDGADEVSQKLPLLMESWVRPPNWNALGLAEQTAALQEYMSGSDVNLRVVPLSRGKLGAHEGAGPAQQMSREARPGPASRSLQGSGGSCPATCYGQTCEEMVAEYGDEGTTWLVRVNAASPSARPCRVHSDHTHDPSTHPPTHPPTCAVHRSRAATAATAAGVRDATV